jgi:hypothetical protein
MMMKGAGQMVRRWSGIGALGLFGSALASGCAAEEGLEPEPDAGDVSVGEDALSSQSWKTWMPAAGTVYTNIPVCFEPDSGFSTTEKSTIKTHAEASWDSWSRVDFTGWRTCTYTCDFTDDGQPTFCSSDQRGIHVTKRDRGRSTEIGSNIAGVKDGLWLPPNPDKATIIHEFGHAISYTHEQERRDNTVCGADATQSQPDLGITEFDNDSIMSYCSNVSDLTTFDIQGVRATYGSDVTTLPYSNEPSQTRYALRAATGHFIGVHGSDVRAEHGHVKNEQKFWIDKFSGAGTELRYGDTVCIMTPDFFYLRALTGSSDWKIDKVTNVNGCPSDARWVLVNVASPSSTGFVRVNDEIAFRSVYDRYLYRQTNNNVRAHNTAIQRLEKWRILWLPFGARVD